MMMPTILMKAEKMKIYKEYKDNNRVHENDNIDLFVNFRELFQ